MPFRLKKVVIVILFTLLTLSACNGQTSAEPTIDPDTIYTAAAMTVEAQLTQAAESNPTPTETMVPPTEVVPPTNVPLATSITEEAQSQVTPGQPLNTSTPFVLANFTSTPPPPSAQAKYELVAQNPEDGAVLPPGYKFDMTWTIKNTGTETWTQLYTINFFLGDRIGGGAYTEIRYNFRDPVEPGESINVFVDMKTPNLNGEYYSWWKIKDENSNNFGDLDVTLVVSDQATAP